MTRGEAYRKKLREEISILAQDLENQPQEKYDKNYVPLATRYETAVAKHEAFEAEIEKREAKAWQITSFMDEIAKAPPSLSDWDAKAWALLLEKATVYLDGSILFEFKNGQEIKVDKKIR